MYYGIYNNYKQYFIMGAFIYKKFQAGKENSYAQTR